MRRAVRLPRHALGTDFLMSLHPEREQEEGAGDEEEEVNRRNRRPLHAATLTKVTSTSGFLPVHAVAQRRTARRTASRN